MPGVRQKSRGMDQVGIIAGVPVHGLLAHDGDDGGHKSDGAGDSQGLVVAGENVLQPHLADPQPGAQQHDPQQQGGDTLDPFVAIGVGGVCLLFGGFDPNPGDQRGNYIGEGVDRVGDHRAGVAGDPCKEFEAGQNGVASHADKRHLPDGGGFIDGILAGNCVGLLGGVFHGEILLFCVFRQKFLLERDLSRVFFTKTFAVIYEFIFFNFLIKDRQTSVNLNFHVIKENLKRSKLKLI